MKHNLRSFKSALLYREKSLVATFLISAAIILLFLMNVFATRTVIRARSIKRMEEGVDTVVVEIVSKLDRDSKVLNAAADIIAEADLYDTKAVLDVIATTAPLLETMDVCVLLPDNRILQPAGSIIDAEGELDFADEAARGEHVSNRVNSLSDPDVMVLRHFVPILQNGEVAAVLYGRTRLDELPEIMNISHIYNASADVYIIDAETGEFLMDTRHEELGTLDDLIVIDVRGTRTWEDVKKSVLNLEDGYVAFRTQSGWHNFYYMPAGINQWSIAVSVPEREAMDSVFTLQRVSLVSGLLIVAAILLYFLWMRRNAKKTVNAAVERAVLEEKLHKAEAAEKAKTTFLSNMSHDIRTPMNAIIGFATLARTNIDNRDKVQEYMTKIMSSSNYLLSLINDVLDMSRIESGKLHIDEKPCTISDIFRDMRNIILSQMQSKQLNFYMDTLDVVDEDIYCDKLHVNQVLLNLLSNAIKFTPAGGSVYLTVRQNKTAPTGYGSYEISVRDTGIGMSQDFVANLFEPFERERNTTTSGIQGTGLGMAITKSIVDAMGGTIEVHTTEGKGTEFIIYLEFRLQTQRKRVESSEILANLRALVVDDNFSTCDSMTKMLTQLGLRAEWSMYGREAVLRTRQAIEMDNEFFAYLIDWALPDLSGLEVIRQVRELVGDKATIIVMTAYDWSVFEEDARQAGADLFCNKPVFMSDMREMLENAASHRKVTEEVYVLPDMSSLKGRRLLLVEDNELNQQIAQELLVESGFLVETANDGTIALEMMKNAPADWYDLILMDIQMPIMNGYDATVAIRALPDPDKAATPIVAMTANAFEEDRRRALNCGMDDYVAKPINVDELMDIIRKILNRKKS